MRSLERRADAEILFSNISPQISFTTAMVSEAMDIGTFIICYSVGQISSWLSSSLTYNSLPSSAKSVE